MKSSYRVLLLMLALCVADYCARAQFDPGLVVNGGFETGYLDQQASDGWTLSGNYSGGITIGNTADFVHSGSYGVQLGSSPTLGYLSQAIPTQPNTVYYLSMWLDSPDGQTPNEFQVSWNGKMIYDGLDLPMIGWTNLTFLVTATNSSSMLQIGERDDPTYLGLDDISLRSAQPVIASLALSRTNLVINGQNGISGPKYYLLTATNLTLPVSQWAAIATNILTTNGSFTITATNAVNLKVPARFYLLKLP